MNLGSEVIFTITGMVLVFLILILLQLIIRGEGAFFERRNGKKSDGETKKAAEPAPHAAAPAPVQAAPAAAPQVGEGVPAEVVAAIMAAIYTMGNGKYTLKAVRRGHNNWGSAGINDTTTPF